MVKKVTVTAGKLAKTPKNKAVSSPKTKKVSSLTTKNNLPSTAYDVVIIGGGPAGLMAAVTAAQNKARVLIIEKNDGLGKKLLISGGGRCNITNANPNHRDFVSKYGKKGAVLYTPFSIFGVADTLKFFNDLGLETKVEPGFRVFPASDSSFDVLNTLLTEARNLGVEFKLQTSVSGFKANKKAGEISAVTLESGEEISAHNFILATGGLSRPETGSTGDGFSWLTQIGHTVIPTNPSLVPIKLKDHAVSELAGITVDNASISVWQNGQKVLAKKGRVLFTHVGLSGPTILNMSRFVGELLDYEKKSLGDASGEVIISLDFFAGVGLDQMHEMMKQVFLTNINKKIKNLSFKEVPTKVFDLILKQLEIDPEWEINEIKRDERLALINKFKKFDLAVESLLGFDKAVIASGGLALTEVDFKNMRSKLYSNLYLVGDILDLDRPSGGFSLQICWTTGYIAGKSASAK